MDTYTLTHVYIKEITQNNIHNSWPNEILPSELSSENYLSNVKDGSLWNDRKIDNFRTLNYI